MSTSFDFKSDFLDLLPIDNADQRLTETEEVARRISSQGVLLTRNMDHTATFSDPIRQISGPLRARGYRSVWDQQCYLSLVPGAETHVVVSCLPAETEMRDRGWFEYIAAVWAIDQPSYDYLLSQGQGNPFIHHTTLGITALDRGASESDLDYGLRLVPYMVDVRKRIEQASGEAAGNLIMAVPESLIDNLAFVGRLPEMTRGLDGKSFTLEPMQRGGFLLQFFVLPGGRVEIALRHGTSQTFNPISVKVISSDEISVTRELMETPLATAPAGLRS
jgi:hypothetical protein